MYNEQRNSTCNVNFGTFQGGHILLKNSFATNVFFIKKGSFSQRFTVKMDSFIAHLIEKISISI